MASDSKSIVSTSSKHKTEGTSYPPESAYKPEVEVYNLNNADVDTFAQVLDSERLDATPEEYSHVLKKIDWYLMPIMCVVYCLTFLDKTVINYAHLLRFEEDLHFSEAQYSWLGSQFYIAYIFALPIHSALFQKVPLGRYLAACVFLWGVTLTLHAACFNYAGLVACRLALGACEAAVTPGFILITGRFYSGQEINTRTALWFSFNGWAQCLGGLISYGLLRQKEAAIPLWRECFIVIGLITVAFGVVTLIFMPSEPGKLWILSDREKLIAVERVRVNETGITSHKWEWYQVKEAVIDPRVWILFLSVISMDVANGALTNFGTTVISSLGFDKQKTSLLGLAQGGTEVLACIVIVVGSRYTKPSIMGSFCFIVSIVGAGVLASHASNVAKVSLYMFVTWFAPASMVLYAILARSFSGETKRVCSTAIFSIGYAAGNIIGAQIYRAKDAPAYTPAKIAMVSLLTVGWVMYTLLFLTHTYLNRQRDREFGTNPEHDATDDLSNQTDWEKRRFFRYPL